MITIDDLTTPTENIANWVEDHRPANVGTAPPAAPVTSEDKNTLTIHFAIDPYQFMAMIVECLRPYEDAFHAVNETLRRWRALYCPPTPAAA